MPGRAEPALAGPGGHEGVGPAVPLCRGSSPSIVVTSRPATRRTGVTHDTRGSPSTQTVQQPHWPCGLQPSLTERQPQVLAQRVEEGDAVGDGDLASVQDEGDEESGVVLLRGRTPGRAGLS